MKRLLLVLITSSLTSEITLAASGGDEVLATLQARINSNRDVSEVYDLIEDLPISEIQELDKRIERVWPNLLSQYISNFEKTARQPGAKAKENKNRVSDLRKELAALKALPDGPMKIALKNKGMPALNELRTLLLPSVQSIMASADEDLKKQRRALIAVAGLRDKIIEVAIIPANSTIESQITLKESEATHELSGLDKKGLRVMEKNRKTAEKEKVPEAERKGVEDANIMRLLAGYSALEIDPKLCAASRDHSKDMETHQFFAHNSPVKGKTTPWDRAKNFRTTSSGENIYMGSTNPLAANRGWFYSPGHHRNMFNPGHKRIGLGQHNRHWTQMFGN